jgi:hypothetical protein
MSDWSTFAVSNWNVGFQADLYKQKGGRSQVVPASNRSAARSLYT